MCVFLIPIIYYQRQNSNNPRVEWTRIYENLEYPYIFYIVLDSIAWSINVLTWCFGVKYTTTVRASLFASTHPLMLVVTMYISGHDVHWLEWVGVLVILAGTCYSFGFQLPFTSVDSNGSPAVSTWYGDSLCLISAFTDMVIIIIRSRTTQHMTTLQVSSK